MNDGIGSGTTARRQASEKRDDEGSLQRVMEGGRTQQRQTGWWSKSEVRARNDDVFSERNKDEKVCTGTSSR